MINQNVIDDMQMPLDAGRCPKCSGIYLLTRWMEDRLPVVGLRLLTVG